jgi:hypothetical protein
MTAQAHETIIYEGEQYGMADEPLYKYLLFYHFFRLRRRPKFVVESTACWRGYYGTWEIKDEKLYLIKLLAYTKGYKEVDIEFVFPGKREVFAWWFTGEIRIPLGKLLKYVHSGYDSVFEEDLFLAFYKGILVNSRIEDNRDKENLDDEWVDL